MPKFRRKPHFVEAKQFQGGELSAIEIVDWVLANGGEAVYKNEQPVAEHIAINHQFFLEKDCWLILREDKQFFPAGVEFFEGNYEPIED